MRRLRAAAPLAFVLLGFLSALAYVCHVSPELLAFVALAGWITAGTCAWSADDWARRAESLERRHNTVSHALKEAWRP